MGWTASRGRVRLDRRRASPCRVEGASLPALRRRSTANPAPPRKVARTRTRWDTSLFNLSRCHACVRTRGGSGKKGRRRGGRPSTASLCQSSGVVDRQQRRRPWIRRGSLPWLWRSTFFSCTKLRPTGGRRGDTSLFNLSIDDGRLRASGRMVKKGGVPLRAEGTPLPPLRGRSTANQSVPRDVT